MSEITDITYYQKSRNGILSKAKDYKNNQDIKRTGER